MRKRRSVGARAAALLMVTCGCGPDPDPVVATIADEQVTLADLTAFAGSNPVREEAEGSGLDRLVEFRLLLAEARASGLESGEWLDAAMAPIADAELLKLYRQREIADRVIVSDEDILQFYNERRYDRALRFSLALVPADDVEATEALRRGDRAFPPAMGGYLLPHQINAGMATRLFSLEVGTVSAPFALTWGGEPQLLLVRVEGEKSMPMRATQRSIAAALFAARSETMAGALANSVRHRSQAGDDADALFLGEARAGSLDSDPEYLARLAARRDRALVDSLIRSESGAGVATEAEARQLLSRRPDLFPAPQNVTIEQVVASSRRLAENLRRELENGAPAAPLALLLGGEGVEDRHPRMLGPQDEDRRLYETAVRLPVGAVAGPLPVSGGYAVFRIVAKSPLSGDEAQELRRVQAVIDQTRGRERRTGLIARLKSKYPVQTYPEVLSGPL